MVFVLGYLPKNSGVFFGKQLLGGLLGSEHNRYQVSVLKWKILTTLHNMISTDRLTSTKIHKP